MLANWIALLMARLSVLESEEGQGMAEYGLILVLIALAVIVTLGLLGGQLDTTFNDVVTGLGGAATP